MGKLQKLKKEQVEKAVEFWTAKLGNPCVNILSEKERKEPQNQDIVLGEQAATASALMSKPIITRQIREKFKKALRQILVKTEFPEHSAFPSGIGPLFIDVDYHPCFLLKQAVEAVGIDSSKGDIFPTKVSMWIEPEGGVLVRDGYHQPERYL